MVTSAAPNDAKVDAIIDQLLEGLPRGSVPAAIFGNPAVYERELRAIFGRCWVYLAHESEIPEPKDFVLRKIGEDSFIVIRDKDRQVRALFNACKHRGVKVCRTDAGSAGRFVCPYHGWTFDTKGALVGAPLWSQAYGEMSKPENGLLSARVESYRGLVFGTLDPEAPPLADYLGGMTWYLDLIFGLNEHGLEMLAAPQRVVIDANWKSAAENFAGDDYHLGTLHRSAIEGGAFPVPFEENMNGYHVQAAPGHSLSLSMAVSADEPGPQFFGAPADLAASFHDGMIGAEKFEVARRARVFVGNVFPNFSLIAAPVSEDSAMPPIGMVSLRVWQPAGPQKIEIWNWFFAHKNLSPDQKSRVYRAALGSFSVAGLFEMDDTDPWGTTCVTGASVAAEALGLDFNYQMGLDGVGSARQVEDWPGPGLAYAPRFDEGVQRNLYGFYGQLMRSPQVWPGKGG